MKIAICDDEKHYCKQIQECVEIYLDKHHIYGKTEIFMDGNALLERGMLAEFDALFLDVEFGGKAQGMKLQERCIREMQCFRLYLCRHLLNIP